MLHWLTNVPFFCLDICFVGPIKDEIINLYSIVSFSMYSILMAGLHLAQLWRGLGDVE